MGSISLVSTDEGVFYRVSTYQPGTVTSGTLLEPERLKIAIFATAGATMSPPRVARVLAQPDPTDDYEMESFLPCNERTTRALLATGFPWDDAAQRQANMFGVPSAEAEQLMAEVERLYQQKWDRFRAWLQVRDGMPPIPPWESSAGV